MEDQRLLLLLCQIHHEMRASTEPSNSDERPGVEAFTVGGIGSSGFPGWGRLETKRGRRFRLVVGHHQLPAPTPNGLPQCFVATTLNRIWVGDGTLVSTRAGWLYVAVLLDLCSRRVIGWAMREKPDQQLPLMALAMAVRQRRICPGLIHHSDQGAQYSCVAYQRQLSAVGITPSMSRRGNCYDNAVAERFFSTLTNELVHHQTYHTRNEASLEILAYIEGFYNRQRLHQSLGYLSPLEFERRLGGS